jgi:hypothetical protein
MTALVLAGALAARPSLIFSAALAKAVGEP